MNAKALWKENAGVRAEAFGLLRVMLERKRRSEKR
jgi:hypothetical protein